MNQQRRRKPAAEPLDEGDTIELSVTLNENYQAVRAGASTTIRAGESVEAAQRRLRTLLLAEATAVMEDIA